MTKYEVELDIPFRDTEEFIERLREFGYPKIIFYAETSDDPDLNTKKKLADNIANSVGHWYYYHWEKFGPQWWYENLKAIRGKRAKENS